MADAAAPYSIEQSGRDRLLTHHLAEGLRAPLAIEDF
jgi:hypothetical protein